MGKIANNVVIGGSFEGQKIRLSKLGMFIGDIQVNKETIDDFELMNENVNTSSFTKGSNKKSMVRSGAKGAVGAAIGTVIAPGIGTLIGAGAGVATSKGKNKSITKEVTTKDVLVAIYFKDGKQSLVKMDGFHYEKFLARAFSDPIVPKIKEPKPKRELKQKDKKSNYLILKSLGWLVIPYIMLPVFWKKLSNQYRIVGSVWSAIIIINFIVQNLK